MASHSQDVAADYGRTNSRVSHTAGETSRAQEPRGRVNSADVTHCGGHFVEGGHDKDASEYPAHLEINEEEDHDRQPHDRYQYGQSPPHRSPSRGGDPSLSLVASSTSNSRTPTLTRAHLQPYLQPGDPQRLGLQSADGRSRSRRTRGFGKWNILVIIYCLSSECGAPSWVRLRILLAPTTFNKKFRVRARNTGTLPHKSFPSADSSKMALHVNPPYSYARPVAAVPSIELLFG